MSKFKVGQWVVRVGQSDEKNGMIHGNTYQVREISGTDSWLQFDNAKGAWNPENFTLTHTGWQDHVVEAPIREPNAELIEQIKQKVLQELKKSLTLEVTHHRGMPYEGEYKKIIFSLNGETISEQYL